MYNIKTMKHIRTFFAALSFLLFIPALASAQTWTGPTGPPPANNIYAPINTSGTGQIKSGGVEFNTSGATYGLLVQSGSVGIDTTAPGAALEVDGTLFANTTSNSTGGFYYGGASNGLIIGKYLTSPWPGTNGLYVGGTVQIGSAQNSAGNIAFT